MGFSEGGVNRPDAFMTPVYLNQIETAVPDNDIHEKFVAYAPSLLNDERSRVLFRRMADKSHIAQRFSVLKAAENPENLDDRGFYHPGGFPGTAMRMKLYESCAFNLARRALDRFHFEHHIITHIIVTSCTGFYAPGLDHQIVRHYGMRPTVERSFIGFMGCHAAINALKQARHIVRSQPNSKVLILNLELCTLHLQQGASLEELLSFILFADGCAASIVSAEPAGIEMDDFHTEYLPDSHRMITWRIGDEGFNMHLSGHVPAIISDHIGQCLGRILKNDRPQQIQSWAIHPGGRSIIDAVRDGAGLDEGQLAASRKILKNYGNMSSPTIMFVLKEMMKNPASNGAGIAMAFGPGLSVEAMRFSKCAN